MDGLQLEKLVQWQMVAVECLSMVYLPLEEPPLEVPVIATREAVVVAAAAFLFRLIL